MKTLASCDDSGALGSGKTHVALEAEEPCRIRPGQSLRSVYHCDSSLGTQDLDIADIAPNWITSQHPQNRNGYPHENQDSVTPSLAAELIGRIEKNERSVADEMKKLFEEFACLERDVAYLRIRVGDLQYDKRNTQEHLAKLSHGLDHLKQDLPRKTADSVWLFAKFARCIATNVSELASEINGHGLKNCEVVQDHVNPRSISRPSIQVASEFGSEQEHDCLDVRLWPSQDSQELWKQVEQLELLAEICNFEENAFADTAKISRLLVESSPNNFEQNAIHMQSVASKPHFEQCAQPGSSNTQLQSSQRLLFAGLQNPNVEPTRYPCSVNKMESGLSKKHSRVLGLPAPPDVLES